MGSVYLIHFTTPYCHARHYLGYTSKTSPDERLNEHLNARFKGNALVYRAYAEGHDPRLAHVWVGVERDMERKLKRQKNISRFCPLCKLERETKKIKSKEKEMTVKFNTSGVQNET